MLHSDVNRKSLSAIVLGANQPTTSSVARALLLSHVVERHRRSPSRLNHTTQREKTMRVNRRLTVLTAASVLLTGICGCGTFLTDSVLKGTWDLKVSNPPPLLTKLTITFDRDGKVSNASYYFSDKATVGWNNPTNEVSVNGDQIIVSVEHFGQGFTFTGTLNSTTAPTSAAGKLNLNFSIANVDLSVLEGDATLVKQ